MNKHEQVWRILERTLKGISTNQLNDWAIGRPNNPNDKADIKMAAIFFPA